MKIKIEYAIYAIIAVMLVIIAFVNFGSYLSLGTQSYVDITANSPTEINYASIILVNPTDCCTPTIQVTTPWDSVETMKISMGQTITLVNGDNPTEKYIIKSIGEGIQYAVPGSGFYEDTVTSVRLDTSYVEGEPVATPTETVTPTPTATPTDDDKPNVLLALVVLIGLSFIVMFITEKRKK